MAVKAIHSFILAMFRDEVFPGLQDAEYVFVTKVGGEGLLNSVHSAETLWTSFGRWICGYVARRRRHTQRAMAVASRSPSVWTSRPRSHAPHSLCYTRHLQPWAPRWRSAASCRACTRWILRSYWQMTGSSIPSPPKAAWRKVARAVGGCSWWRVTHRCVSCRPRWETRAWFERAPMIAIGCMRERVVPKVAAALKAIDDAAGPTMHPAKTLIAPIVAPGRDEAEGSRLRSVFTAKSPLCRRPRSSACASGCGRRERNGRHHSRSGRRL